MTSKVEPHNPKWTIGAIEHNPKISVHIGVFVAEFATLEFMLVRLMGLVLKEPDYRLALRIMGGIRNMSDRCDILKAAAKAADLDPDAKKHIIEFVDAIRSINTRRNEYVHAVYETETKPPRRVRMTPWATSTTRKTGNREILTTGRIQADVLEIRKVTARIIKRLFPDEMVPLAAPPSSPEKPA